MRKVYLQRKTYYDYIMFYYKIKFCVDTATAGFEQKTFCAMYTFCLMCKIFRTKLTLIFIALAVLFFRLFVSVAAATVKKLFEDDVKISITHTRSM